MTSEQLKQWSADILYLQDINRKQQAEIEALKKQVELHKNAHHEALKFAVTPLTEDECEAIINKHDWFSKSWREMAKEIHDAILRKAQEK
jgi:endonuclease/exonuclease/phosphatase (EEP) superfamily protein YafD